MKLSAPEKEVIVKFTAKYPLPATDDGSREWTHMLCQQMKFSFPGVGWGHKRQAQNHPHSSDCIAMQTPFIGWDVVSNSGTANATLSLDGEAYDLTGQVFEPVEAVNHLGTQPPDPEPPQPPDPEPDACCQEMLAELKKHTILLAAIANNLTAGIKIKF